MRNIIIISALVLIPAFALAKPVVKTIKEGKKTEVHHTDGSKTTIKTNRDGTTTTTHNRTGARDTAGTGYKHGDIVKEVVRHD
jgi:hypothetical protein